MASQVLLLFKAHFFKLLSCWWHHWMSRHNNSRLVCLGANREEFRRCWLQLKIRSISLVSTDVRLCSNWYTRDLPGGVGDFELTDTLSMPTPAVIPCPKNYHVQARLKGSTQVWKWFIIGLKNVSCSFFFDFWLSVSSVIYIKWFPSVKSGLFCEPKCQKFIYFAVTVKWMRKSGIYVKACLWDWSRKTYLVHLAILLNVAEQSPNNPKMTSRFQIFTF